MSLRDYKNGLLHRMCKYQKIATNFVNTIKHLSQSSSGDVNPLMGMLGISQLVPQVATLGNLPQMAAMSPFKKNWKTRLVI